MIYRVDYLEIVSCYDGAGGHRLFCNDPNDVCSLCFLIKCLWYNCCFVWFFGLGILGFPFEIGYFISGLVGYEVFQLLDVQLNTGIF